MEYQELFDEDDLQEIGLLSSTPKVTEKSPTSMYMEKTYISEEESKRIVGLMLNLDFKHCFKI